jgi:mRNA interferase MazF
MVTPPAGAIVLVSFPFSDLSASKIRPALVLADAGKSDFILCQITSNPYADPNAVQLNDSDFSNGGLQVVSYIRPGKLFTASSEIMIGQPGIIRREKLISVVDTIIRMLKQA